MEHPALAADLDEPDERRTIAVGLRQFQDPIGTDRNPPIAAVTMATVPVVVLDVFAQR